MPDHAFAVVGGEDQVAELRSLLSVLREDDLRALAPSLVRGESDPEDLGVSDEVISLATDPKLVAGVAGVLTTWLTTRKRAVKLRIKRGNSEVTLDSGSPKDAEKILERLEGFLNEE